MIITDELRAAAHVSAARTATAAYLEIRDATNRDFQQGAMTYGEMKAAINNASYVMDAVRKLAGLEPWVLSDDEPA